MVQVDFTPLSEDLSRKMFRLSPLRLFGIIVALGLGLFLMLAFQLTYVFFFVKPEKFEASTWLLLRKEHSPRLDCMAKDLVCSQELSGMTFQAVVQKLGSPDSIEYNDLLTKDGVLNPDPKELHGVTYFLQSQSRRLNILFSPSGVVSKTFMGSTGGL
jgi:capsular polysaccharide biosynthesis protein